MKRHAVATVAALFSLGCAARAPLPPPAPVRLVATPVLVSAPPEEVGFDAALGTTIDSIMTEGVADGAAPGAVLVVGRYGRIVHMGAYGRIDTPANAPAVTDSTLFDLASLTKVVAGTTVAMMLEEEGQLDLDLPVHHYLPEFDAPDKAGITVRHLLTHSAGFISGTSLWRDYSTREEFLRAINERPLAYTPGDSAIYSDWSLITGGIIIERVTGLPLDVTLRQRVWEPLGMRDTGFNPLARAPLLPGQPCTVAYRADHPLLARIAATELDSVYRNGITHGIVHDENACAVGGVSGHAGLFSSARDLAVFAQMLLNGGYYGETRILDPNTIARWTARQNPGSSRALGWDTPSGNSSAGRFASPRSFGHTGFTGTSMWMDPERGLFVIMLTNRVNPTRQNTRHERLRRDVSNAIHEALTDAPLIDWRPPPER